MDYDILALAVIAILAVYKSFQTGFRMGQGVRVRIKNLLKSHSHNRKYQKKKRKQRRKIPQRNSRAAITNTNGKYRKLWYRCTAKGN